MKQPTMHLDRCPECLSPWPVDETLAKLREAKIFAPLCGTAICVGCGHVVAVSPSDDGLHVEASSAPYDWFQSFHDEGMRRQLREDQEKIHHGLGQWG